MTVIENLTEVDWRRALALDDGVRGVTAAAGGGEREELGGLFLSGQLDGTPALVADTKSANEAIGAGDEYGGLVNLVN